MQKLQFEHSWNKAISMKDRKEIEQLFQNTFEFKNSNIICHSIRQAINHKNQMLITVLIHNFTDGDIAFDNREVHCLLEEGSVSQKFTIPALTIPSQTSMPWTFIFEDSVEFLFTELLEVKIDE